MTPLTGDDALSLLSPRKQQVARYVAQGMTDKRIAAILGRTEDTVSFHIAGIARIWRLDPLKNIRVQITQRVFLKAG